jgi:hypothetical protein
MRNAWRASMTACMVVSAVGVLAVQPFGADRDPSARPLLEQMPCEAVEKVVYDVGSALGSAKDVAAHLREQGATYVRREAHGPTVVTYRGTAGNPERAQAIVNNRAGHPILVVDMGRAVGGGWLPVSGLTCADAAPAPRPGVGMAPSSPLGGSASA